MCAQQASRPFSAEQQRQYEREARLQYGPELVNESVRRWNGYSQLVQDAILEEAGAVYRDLTAAIEAGVPAESDEAQAMVARWHGNLRHFYEPTLEVLQGLGALYNSDPAFMAFFQQIHPDLPAYLQAAIAQYADTLETAQLEAMLAADAAKRLRR